MLSCGQVHASRYCSTAPAIRPRLARTMPRLQWDSAYFGLIRTALRKCKIASLIRPRPARAVNVMPLASVASPNSAAAAANSHVGPACRAGLGESGSVAPPRVPPGRRDLPAGPGAAGSVASPRVPPGRRDLPRDLPPMGAKISTVPGLVPSSPNMARICLV